MPHAGWKTKTWNTSNNFCRWRRQKNKFFISMQQFKLTLRKINHYQQNKNWGRIKSFWKKKVFIKAWWPNLSLLSKREIRLHKKLHKLFEKFYICKIKQINFWSQWYHQSKIQFGIWEIISFGTALKNLNEKYTQRFL